MHQHALLVWLVLLGGVAAGLITDTVNCPIDSWFVVEPTYAATVGLIVGVYSDIRHWRNGTFR